MLQTIKNYILFLLLIVQTVAITYYSIKYNIEILVPWITGAIFFLLWRYERTVSKKYPKIKPARDKWFKNG